MWYIIIQYHNTISYVCDWIIIKENIIKKKPKQKKSQRNHPKKFFTYHLWDIGPAGHRRKTSICIVNPWVQTSQNTIWIENKEQDTAYAKYAAFYIHIRLKSCYITEYTDKHAPWNLFLSVEWWENGMCNMGPSSIIHDPAYLFST